MGYDPSLVISQYGAVLELAGDSMAVPDRLLPYPKEAIKSAVRAAILALGPNDEMLWAYQQSYLALSQFLPEADVAEIQHFRAATGPQPMSPAVLGWIEETDALLGELVYCT